MQIFIFHIFTFNEQLKFTSILFCIQIAKILVSLCNTSAARQRDKYQNLIQWRSQNAEKDTQIKGRLLFQALILYNYAPFQNRYFS